MFGLNHDVLQHFKSFKPRSSRRMADLICKPDNFTLGNVGCINMFDQFAIESCTRSRAEVANATSQKLCLLDHLVPGSAEASEDLGIQWVESTFWPGKNLTPRICVDIDLTRSATIVRC